MTLMGDEPELGLGDSGEHVTQLQDRLRGLKLMDSDPHGTYDAQTEAAVQQLQSNLGHSADGRVSQETWQALDRHMLDQGLHYDPYAQPGQQHWDLATPASAEEHNWQGSHGGQAVREDARWEQPDAQGVEPYWDGEKWLRYDLQSGQWQPLRDTDQKAHGAAQDEQLSADGLWRWDGNQWQPTGPVDTPAEAGEPASYSSTRAPAAETGSAVNSQRAMAAEGSPVTAGEAQSPAIPHPDHVHSAIREDERFSELIDFLHETHAQ